MLFTGWCARGRNAAVLVPGSAPPAGGDGALVEPDYIEVFRCDAADADEAAQLWSAFNKWDPYRHLHRLADEESNELEP